MLIKPFYALCVSTKREKMLLASISKNLIYYIIKYWYQPPSLFYILFLSKLFKNANLDSSLF